MTKSELQGLLNQISSVATSNSENLNEYLSVLKLCLEKLQNLLQEDKRPMLDTWLGMGIQELRREIYERFSENYKSLSTDRQKAELLYSRTLVTMTLTNILMHL